jgi:nucleoside 2-deoxyribosyltransferase
MKKIYLAGPEVFLPNAIEWFSSASKLCRGHDFEALIPLNPNITEPLEVFAYNIGLIKKADYMLANVTPFRGTEPDSGTVWEMGFAFALDKSVIAYSMDMRKLKNRTMEYFQHEVNEEKSSTFFADGFGVDKLGGSLNLMLSASSSVISGDLELALRSLMIKECYTWSKVKELLEI